MIPDQTDKRVDGLEARIVELNERLSRLEAQMKGVTHTEAQTREASPDVTRFADSEVLLSTEALSGGLGQLLPMIGRSSLIFGGAFLLRALTDAGVVPHGLGVLIALLYAVGWLFAAWRTGSGGQGLNAEFHGVTAVIIAFPMLIETTVRFKLISAAAAAAILVALLATTLVILWQRHLPVTAWALALASSTAALVLARFTLQVELFTAVAVVFALISWVFALWRAYQGMQWAPLLAADLMVLRACVAVSASGGPHHPSLNLSPGLVLLTAVMLLAGCLAIVATRLLASHGRAGGSDIILTIAAIAASLGGSAQIVGSSGAGAIAVGSTAVLLGLAFYGLAFAFVERRHGRGAEFFFATSIGLTLCIFGGLLATSGGVLGVVWSLLGLAAAASGGRFDRVTLRSHAAIFVVLASGASGLFAMTAEALFGDLGNQWSLPSITLWATLAAILLSYVVLVFSSSARECHWYARLPRFIIATIGEIAILAMAVRMSIAAVPGGLSDPALLAAARSMLIAAAVIGLAAAGRIQRVRELAWLVYPMLALAGCRLLFVDLRVGRGITLFPTFILFGVTLLLTPRLMRRPSQTE